MTQDEFFKLYTSKIIKSHEIKVRRRLIFTLLVVIDILSIKEKINQIKKTKSQRLG